MTERQRQVRMNIAAFLLLFFVSLYRQVSLRYLPDDPFRTYILYACYLFLIGGWAISICVRVTQKSMRTFLMLEAAVMLAGLTVRFLQDTFWIENILLVRVSGLSLEATILLGLVLSIYASLGIGQWDNFRVRKSWYLLMIPVIWMAYLCLTDESRHFMFYTVPEEVQPNLNFHPYIGTFVLLGFGIVLMIVRVLLIYKRNQFANAEIDSQKNNTASDEIYVIGNPPYKGARWQTSDQKSDMLANLGKINGVGNLDYISIWFKKASEYIKDTRAEYCFVTTNSICQGQSVSLLWPHVLIGNLEIGFAYSSFKWQNNAKDQAGVTVTIISLRNKQRKKKYLYAGETISEVDNINAYLLPTDDFYVESAKRQLSDIPDIDYGSFALDDGVFTISAEEYKQLIANDARIKPFLKSFIGSAEFLRGITRYALYIPDNQYQIAKDIPDIAKKVAHVKEWRSKSNRSNTKKLASTPWRFAEIRYKEKPCILIPIVSSENRQYIPMGYLEAGTIVSNAAFAVYDAEPWLFSLLESKMHMAWIRTVCGKLKTDYRYSSSLGYNTFPVPPLSPTWKEMLNDSAMNILMARENHTEMTLAQMYDPDEMPEDLRNAHDANDLIVDKLYQDKAFLNDEERLAKLFAMYEDMTKDKKK